MGSKLPSLIEEKFRTIKKNSKQIFEFVAAVVTIVGWIIVAFSFGKDLLPGTDLKAFAQKVSDLRLGQNYSFIEKKLGIPTIIEDIKYQTSNNTDERGSVATYYADDYIVLTYFDNNHSLFGYVVISDSKYFNPRIPSTINSAKDGQQRLNNLPIKNLNPSNYSHKDWAPLLVHQYIFARSGSPDLEKYYIEIYDMLNDGYFGVAITDINRESKSMEDVFTNLGEITKPEESNSFYQHYKKYFDFVNFHISFSEEAKDVQKKIYEKTKINNEEMNSYFFFSKISKVDTNRFIENRLKNNYFITKQTILQLK
ncbi:ETEC_3214 domain-containing protein [Gorillibacterium timonense]|uniref:ETEC_3214 domain-containing protein n=1 Tax=Gorillibacterium timonense TaxID=1689269 RepID=UPI00071C5727|nr:ETEC_3214 domain-containing protein [Gorillibacterium timonense]